MKLDDKLAEAAGTLLARAQAGESIDTLGPDITAMTKLARDASNLGTKLAIGNLLDAAVKALSCRTEG